MQVLTSQVTFKRKATEVLLALRVDKYFTKKEILQDYLNIATLGRNNKGQNVAGVQEAAQGLFGKDAKNLTLAEAAYIVWSSSKSFRLYTVRSRRYLERS
ncbi:transglycosylase domain-containing protein [Latilactobacillus sakei]